MNTNKVIWIINHYASHLETRHLELGKFFSEHGYKCIVITSSFHHGKREYLYSDEIHVEEKLNDLIYVYLHSGPAYQNNGIKRVINFFDFNRLTLKYESQIAKDYGKPNFIIGSSLHPLVWESSNSLSNKYGSKWIAEFRDLWPLQLTEIMGLPKWHPMVIFFGIVEKRAYRRSDAIVSTMPYAYKYVCDELGFPRDKVHWMPNGINTKRTDEFLHDNSICIPQELHDFLRNNWCCVYCGSLVKGECVPFIINSFNYLKSMPKIKLVIIGDGHYSDEIKKSIDINKLDTGQHFDYNMSEQFFRELDIPDPDYNLGISGGSHAQMVGKMMIAIEEVLHKEKPDWLLVYGDTNSTLAAALAAAKLYIPICHVEAGARVHSMTNPEEINRICTDHVSTLLLACTQSGYDEMEKEGLQSRGILVGDPMYDAFQLYSNKLKIEDITLDLLFGGKAHVPEKYYYLTCHREENTNDDEVLSEIFKAAEALDAPTIYPVHPRNKQRALRLHSDGLFTNVILTEPVGYLESACLVKNAKKIITDSGGLQREAFFAGKKCVTLLSFVCWPETMVDGRNELCRPIAEEIIEKLNHEQIINGDYQPFGDGHSAARIVDAMENNIIKRIHL